MEFIICGNSIKNVQRAQEAEFAHYYKMKDDKVITKLRLF